MKPEEKNTLLQFMGQVYGETKKQDQMLVGQSTNLKPKSEEVKRQFEQVLRSNPTTPQRQPQQNLPPVQQPIEAPAEVPSTPSSVVTPEQAAAELAQAQQVTAPESTQTIVYPLNDPNQMEFDLSEPSKVDKIIELLEKQNRLLVEIRDSSIKSKYNAKRAKNKKPQ